MLLSPAEKGVQNPSIIDQWLRAPRPPERMLSTNSRRCKPKPNRLLKSPVNFYRINRSTGYGFAKQPFEGNSPERRCERGGFSVAQPCRIQVRLGVRLLIQMPTALFRTREKFFQRVSLSLHDNSVARENLVVLFELENSL
jgi:hypothetical protein